MKKKSTNWHSSQKDSPESQGSSNWDVVESNSDRPGPTDEGDRLQPDRVNDWSHQQWTQEDKQAQIGSRNGYGGFPQYFSKPTRPSLWQRIPYGVKVGAFCLAALGLVVAALEYPSPSIKEQQPKASVGKVRLEPQLTPPLGVPTPPSSLPELALPSPAVSPLPQLSPLPTVPIPDQLTTSSLPKSKDQPLTVSPSLPEKPTPNLSDLIREASPSKSVPVKPPSLPLPLESPVTPSACSEPSCSESATPNEAPAAEKTEKNTKIDKNAPAAEVSNYFKERWKAPAGLTEKLEYSLSINKDGTIERITPLSNTASEYIDSTKMPLPGDPLVSPMEGAGKTNILLVLSPDGKVKASLE